MPLIPVLQSIAAADASGVGTIDTTGLAFSATLAGTLTLTVAHPMICKLDPGGAGRDVNLEAEGVCPGRVRLIVNSADAGEVLTIKNDGGSTISTPTQNEAALLYCDGTAWSEIAVFTISFT